MSLRQEAKNDAWRHQDWQRSDCMVRGWSRARWLPYGFKQTRRYLYTGNALKRLHAPEGPWRGVFDGFLSVIAGGDRLWQRGDGLELQDS